MQPRENFWRRNTVLSGKAKKTKKKRVYGRSCFHHWRCCDPLHSMRDMVANSASMELIEQTTKACPSCKSKISKVRLLTCG